MARLCTVCQNEHSEIINKMLVSGEKLRTLTDVFKLSRQALIRHRDRHIPALLLKAENNREIMEAESLGAEVKLLRDKVYKLLSAAEAKLTDPEDNQLYTIDPDLSDLYITVEDEGKRIRKRLDSFLSEKKIKPVIIEVKKERPARLLLNAIQRAESLVELRCNLDFVKKIEEIEEYIEAQK